MDINAYDHLFKKYAEPKGLDWLLLKAQVKQESRFKPDSVSPVGAMGLAQFMRATWEEWWDGTPGIQIVGMVYDRKNPEYSIRAQAAYMAWLIKRVRVYTNKDVEKYALMCYNYGTRPIKWLRQGLDYTQIFNKIPTETKIYVARIISYYNEYKKELFLKPINE